MQTWQKIVIYIVYGLLASALALLLLGKNVRSQVYVVDRPLAGLSPDESEVIVRTNPGGVSVRGAFVAGETVLFSLPAPVALPIFLGSLPLLSIFAAYFLLKTHTSLLKILGIGFAGSLVLFLIIYAIPRA